MDDTGSPRPLSYGSMLHELDLEVLADGIQYESAEQENAMWADLARRASAVNLTALWPAIQAAADDGETPYPVECIEIYSDDSLVAFDDTGRMVKYTLFIEEYGDGYHEPREHCEYVEHEVLH